MIPCPAPAINAKAARQFGAQRRALGSALCGALYLMISSAAAAIAEIEPAKSSAESAGNWPRSSEAIQLPSLNRRKLALHYCFDSADKQNKEILLAASNLPAAQAAVVIAKAIPNPQFNMTYGWGPAWRFIIAGNGQQIGLMEELQVAGKRRKKTELAGASYVQTAFQLAAVRFSVHNRVRRAYAELAAAHAYADIVEAQTQTARRLRDISQKRFELGTAPGAELMQAELGLMQFETKRNQAWGRIVQDSAQLAMLLGECPKQQEIIDIDANPLFKLSDAKTDLVPSPESPPPELQQLLPAAWHERNDLKTALQQTFVARKALTLAKAQCYTNPSVGFNYLFSTYQPFQLNYFDPAGVTAYLDSASIPIKANSDNPAIIQQQVNEVYFNSLAQNANANSASGVSAPGNTTGGPPSGPPANAVSPPPNVLASRVPFQAGYLLSVQQEAPIFYQYQGQVNQAKALLTQQQRQNEELKAKIATDIVSAYEKLLVSQANVGKYRKQLIPQAAVMEKLTRRGYELGKMDLATTILAQQQYQQTLSSFFDTVVAYQNAWADLEQAVGVPLNL